MFTDHTVHNHAVMVTKGGVHNHAVMVTKGGVHNRAVMVTADDVYMEDEVLRDEYVMNDVGKIFFGNYNQIGARFWIYAQVICSKVSTLTDLMGKA